MEVVEPTSDCNKNITSWEKNEKLLSSGNKYVPLPQIETISDYEEIDKDMKVANMIEEQKKEWIP